MAEGEIKRFIATPRPVRVWFNATFVGADGAPFYADTLASSVGLGSGVESSAAVAEFPINRRAPPGGSHLEFYDVRSIDTAIVIVDVTRTTSSNLGQLADYVSMTSLAEINLDRDPGPAPTILHLFAPSSSAPPGSGLSDWDRGLLKALYETSQKEVTQLSALKTQTVKNIAP